MKSSRGFTYLFLAFVAIGIFLLPSASHASVLLTSGTFTPAGTYTCNGWGCDATKTCYRDLYGVY
ncbi:MAG TPA: hypothetical protein VMA75_04055, partial [Candidatus Paceibacterota bacterium]|nr:hypothetical protein [Candidatus Paceibacterota bacterium]